MDVKTGDDGLVETEIVKDAVVFEISDKSALLPEATEGNVTCEADSGATSSQHNEKIVGEEKVEPSQVAESVPETEMNVVFASDVVDSKTDNVKESTKTSVCDSAEKSGSESNLQAMRNFEGCDVARDNNFF